MATETSQMVKTDGSPAFRAFPWTNGVNLAKNRRDYLEDALKESRHRQALVDMALVSVALRVK